MASTTLGRKSPSRPTRTTRAGDSGARREAAAVERWFARSARPLPWRIRRDGYTALVSEAMLQQTQVARVVPAYEEFMRRFPGVRALAAAREQDVLAAWQGLGYYGRARRLHAAAKAIVERFGGDVPREVDALMTLPGVGRYTAGSIASIAFGRRAPIVDTNVARVLLRVHARSGPSGDRRHVEWAWGEATRLVEAASDPALLNEGLMELGATLCTAAAPSCTLCPLAGVCKARAAGTHERVRVGGAAVRRVRVYHHVVVVRRGASYLLEQRPSRGLWSSMWQAPTVEATQKLGVDDVAASLGRRVVAIRRLGEFEHRTTHRDVRFVVHVAATRSRRGVWVDATELASYPLSNPMRLILDGTRPGALLLSRPRRSRLRDA